MSRVPGTFLVAVAGATAFLALGSIRLTAQGMYYDELHQAPAAFTWVGRMSPFFSLVPVRGVATMTMSYDAAIKSGIYGLWLRTSGHDFDVVSWRLLGLGLSSLGVLLFGLLAGPRLGVAALTVFTLLLLSDVTVLLTSRHDWGPTALALLLRLLFMGIWLRKPVLSKAGACCLGAVTGFSIFEKLSSVVLLAPLAIAVGGAWRRSGWALAGVVVGAMPLAFVNLISWRRDHELLSLTQIGRESGQRSARFLLDYASLAQGDLVRQWILDTSVPELLVTSEVILIVALAVLALGMGGPQSRALVGAWVSVAVGIFLLPNPTWVHHWVIGTPFQYGAIAMAGSEGKRRGRRVMLALLVALLLVRLPSLGTTINALMEGQAGARFDPSLTESARYAAQQKDAYVVAATWGIAMQVFCLAQGRRDSVFEAFWSQSGVSAFEHRLESANVDAVYLLESFPPSRVARFDAHTAAVKQHLEDHSGWREVRVEPRAWDSKVVSIRKFVRHGSYAATAMDGITGTPAP